MAADKDSSENVLSNIKDFSSVLKDLSLNRETSEWKCLKKVNSGDFTSPSPTKSTRSSLGILPPGALDNISIVDSIDGSIHFPKLTPDSKEENEENLPPTFFKPRFEIESGILDENGETDLENFLDDKDIKQLDDFYTPSTSTESDSDVGSVTSAITQIKRKSETVDDEPTGAGMFRRPGQALPPHNETRVRGVQSLNLKKKNDRIESSGDDLAVPLNRTYDSPKDQDVFVKPLPPGSNDTPRVAHRPKPQIDTPKQGIPASLFLPNTSMNASKLDQENTPILPPRAPAGWASLLDKSSAMPGSNQQSFNCSGFPWEQLVHKDSPELNTDTSGLANERPKYTPESKVDGRESARPLNKKPSLSEDVSQFGMGMKLPLETTEVDESTRTYTVPPDQGSKLRLALETSAMDPLDPSFCSGKISARSTSLGPSGGIGDRTMDDNFSDFSKPPSFQSSYFSNYSNQDESVVHSGFPPIMSVSGEGSATAFNDQDNVFYHPSANQKPYNPFSNSPFPPYQGKVDSPFPGQAGKMTSPFPVQTGQAGEKFSFSSGSHNLGWQGSNSGSPLYNPFDMNKNNFTSQPVDEQFCEMEGGAGDLEDFFAKEEEECLQNHQFLQEEDMEKDAGDTSMLSGISDKSIILRNNGLWAGDTSQVDLDKLREETRLSRCQYFQLNSSRLGSLEDSIAEIERPHFGFVHKIRSPEHRPSPLIDDSPSDSSNRNTYNVVTPTSSSNTPTIPSSTQHQPPSSTQHEPTSNEDQSARDSEIEPQSLESQLLPSKTKSNGGSCQSSADSTYIQSGDSTKTIVSMDSSGTLKANELAQRLEALTDRLGTPTGPNISYPDVVEASFHQNRDLEKSVASLVDGEINLSTISKALSDANVSLDPQQFVNLIKNSLKPRAASESRDENTDLASTSKSLPAGSKKRDEITVTPKSSLASDSDGKVRRKLSESPVPGLGDISSSRSAEPCLVSDNISRNMQPLVSSTSAPVTPRDTPLPPLSKAISVPHNMDVGNVTTPGRRRNPSGTRHSSPKKSPRKVVVNATPLQGLEDLLEETEHTPSMCVTSRKHLQTSTPFHPNLNLSSVIMDNLGKDKSISPFVNPDHSINAVNLDFSTVSPDLYNSILPAVQHVTPRSASGYTEIRAGGGTHYDKIIHLNQDIHIDTIYSSHCWQTIQIPVIHNLKNDCSVVMKISNVWIGSVEIPTEYWSRILSMESTETVVSVIACSNTVNLRVLARREGAFALNIGLISPGGQVSSGVVRFQVEEPVLRLLTRNGHTVDFGSIVHTTSSSVPVMLVNGGHADLKLCVQIVSDTNLFSLNDGQMDKFAEFTIPGRKVDAEQGEGVGKEIKIWARTGTISKKHPDPRVYSGQLEIRLGGQESAVVLGRVQVLVRVCFSSLVISHACLDFTCAEGKKCVQKIEVKSEGSLPLDVEASTDDNPTGIFIYDKKFKIIPGVSKIMNIEFVAKPGCSGKSCGSLKVVMQPGNIPYKVELNTNVISKLEDNLFSGTDSPGLKLGLMQTTVESLDRFPVDANRSLINWFAVPVGAQERQQITLRSSVSFAIDLNVIIRDSDEFYLQVNEGSTLEQASKLHFNARETKDLFLIYKPKTQNACKGKLVLKPLSVKIKGKVIKATINLMGIPGSADIKILDLKHVENSMFGLAIDHEPPVSRQFRIANQGSATGFVKIVCLETLGQKESESQVIVAPSEFIIEAGKVNNVTLTFSASYASSEANLAIFLGTELVRGVYKRAKQLPGAVRLSGSPALLGIDFTKGIGGDDEEKLVYQRDLTPEDTNHFFHKTEKLTLKVELLEKQACFQELGVEETLSETRLETTTMMAHHGAHKFTDSPPTHDIAKRSLEIIPQNISLDPGKEAIVKIINRTNDTIHWDLNWSAEYLNCSPPAGQLARSAQAILLISTQPDLVLGPQGWRGQVEIFSEQTVDYINVFIKPKSVSSKSVISVSPEYLDFGKSAIGCTMGKKVVSVTNNSPSLIQWKGVVSSPDLFILSQPAGILNPGQTVSIAVSYKPVKSGLSTATLDFISQVVKGPGRDVPGGIQPVTVQLRAQAVSLQLDKQDLTLTATKLKMNTEGAPNIRDVSPSSHKQNLMMTSTSLPGGRNVGSEYSLYPGAAKQSAVGTSTKRGKGTLSLESDNICFGAVPVDSSQVAKVTVKNRTGESQILHLSLEPGSPFSIIHNTLEVKSQSFSRIPIQFRPTSAGNFGAHLVISSESGFTLKATLSGSGAFNFQENITAAI